MRILIPAGAIAAILWLVSRPEWQHASHAKKAGAVVAAAAVFAVIEVAVILARHRKRKPAARTSFPYSAPARRR